MKTVYLILKSKYRLLMVLMLFAAALLVNKGASAQTYCIPSGGSFCCGGTSAMGVLGFKMGDIDNQTGEPTVKTADFTHLSTTACPGDVLNFTVTICQQSYPQQLHIWVDWNKDGTFNTTGTEEAFYIDQTPQYGSHSGTITVPNGTAPGNYRMRVYGDYYFGAVGVKRQPCELPNWGGMQDYTLKVVGGGGTDLSLAAVLEPTQFSFGNNTIKVKLQNVGGTAINTATIGYQLPGQNPVTQNLTSMNLGTCTAKDYTFSSPLNLPYGVYTLKVWATNPNGTQPDANPTNDTLFMTACTPLDGIYTIDPNGSGVNNFSTFSDAIYALKNCGVTAPVTFEVASGTFTEQLIIPTISGTSSTNTITFKGAGKTSTILTYGAQTAGDRHTLALEGCAYVRVKDMTIRSTNGSYGYPLMILNNTDNNIVSNCIIDCGSNRTSTNFMAVAFSSSRSSYSSNVVATNNTIDSCDIRGGYYNISFYSNTSTNMSTGNVISNNTLTDGYNWGIYAYYVSGIKIRNNNINIRTSGSTTTGGGGIFVQYGNFNYPYFHEVSGNKIIDAAQYGIQVYGGGNSGARSVIANNMIGGGFRNTSESYGIWMNGTNWWNIYFNTVNVDNSPSGNGIALYISGSTNQFSHDVRNNLLQVTGSPATSWPLWANDFSIFSDLDFNNYWKKGSSSDVIFVGQNISIGNLKTAYSLNAHSYNLEAPYAGVKNLRHTNGCLTGIQITQVPKDIDGDTRGYLPIVGADEFTNTVTNDIGVLSITAPSSPVSVGLNDVTVMLKNFGVNTITSAQISYTLNGGSQKTINWSGTLAPCSEVAVTFTGSDRVNIAPGINTIRAFSSSPNGVSDYAPGNDATQITACPSMSGTFTIDPAGSGSSNFLSFTHALDALNCSGMSGPVVFEVAAGTYNEQVAIRAVPGLSATNTLTIDGGDGNAASRILTYNNSQYGSFHTMVLDNVSNITIRNITIRNQSPSYGWNLHMLGTVSDIDVSNCRFDYSGGNGASTTSSNFMPIVLSNSTTSQYNNMTFNRVMIDSNYFNGGYSAIWAYGNGTSNTGFSVTNNTIENIYYYGVYFYYFNGTTFKNNQISIRAGNTNSMGVYMSSLTTSGSYYHDFTNNRITKAGRYGWYMASTSNTSGARGKFVNNMIGGGFSSTSAQGLYMTSSNYWDIFFNSINIDNQVSSSTSAALYTTSSNYLDIRNNHFALTHPSINSGSIFPVYMNNASTALVCDYNNYFKFGNTNNFVRINGGVYNATNFKGGGGFNSNSYFLNPIFASSTDLHTSNGCATGVAISGITTDYDGDNRNTVPSIGADEGGVLDASVDRIITPSGTVISGTQNITFMVKNTGRTTLTSFTAGYLFNGGTSVTQNWSGSLAACDSVLITFNSVSIPNGGGMTLAAFVANPNGSTDDVTDNDTTAIGFCNAPLAGNFIIDPKSSAPGSYPNFTSFMNSLYSCGMSGSINVTVGAGTYTEQVYISTAISGLSGNSITFDGGNRALTKITYNAGGYTVRLDGADNITFKNIGIENTGTSSAYAVHLLNTADYNLFDNCVISTGTISNTTVIPFIIGNTYTTYNNAGNYNTVQNSLVSGGYIGVNINGTGASNDCRGNKFLNNTLTSATQYIVRSYYQDEVEFINNEITGSSYGLYMYYNNDAKVQRNNVNAISGNYGIYTQSFNQYGNSRALVENNMITGLTYTSNYPSALYMSSSYNTDIRYNSVNIPATAPYGRAMYISYGSGNVISSNNISAAGANGYAFYSDGNGFTSIDHNNIYVSAGNYVYMWGNNASDLTGLKGINPPFNQNSVSVKPLYISDNDLHIKHTEPAPYGDATLAVTVDIDGDARCVMAKTIGADESKYVAPGASVLFTIPDTVYINSSFMAINAALEGELKMHEWDFNNDGSVESTDRNAQYSFSTTGVKQVKLTTSTCSGSNSLVKSLVVVSPTAVPVADFIADKNEIAPLEPLKLQDLSTNGPTQWDWEINPYDILTFFNPADQNPEVFFSTPGVYEVCLTATNAIGSSQKKCKTAYIKVKDVNSMCLGNSSSTSANGEIYDSGGPTAQYGANENCTYLIEPCAGSINLKFTEFQLGDAGDVLRIYNGPDAASPLIGIYSATSGLPGGTNGITANSGLMFLQWQSNNTTFGSGFAAKWTSTPKSGATVTVDFTHKDTVYELVGANFTNLSTGEGLKYQWDLDGDGFTDDITKNPTFTYFSPGTYYPALTVTDACGNVSSKSDTIIVVSPTVAPVVAFIADARIVAIGDTVRFTDLSSFGPHTWSYVFSPSTATIVGGTAQNPYVVFNATGTYDVELTAENNAGSNSLTKTAYISVVNICVPSVDGLIADLGINRVTLNEMENISSSGVNGFTSYFNNTAVTPAQLDAGGTYEINVSRNSTLNRMNRKIWIDYNGNGSFSDAGELIGHETASLNASWNLSFTVPTSAIRGATRMRIGAAFADSTNQACGTNFFGEIEEYRVVINDDITPPTLTLVGTSPVTVEIGNTYTDLGATAFDAVDGNVTSSIVVSSNVVTNVAGTYYVRYNVSDAAGNAATELVRTVIVTPDVTKPVLSLTAPLHMTIPVYTSFVEPGFSAMDNISGNVTSSVVVDLSELDTATVGSYNIYYTATDGNNNTDVKVRVVNVVDITAPVITLNGANPLEIEVYSPFSDPGVIVSDNYDQVIFATSTNNVNVNSLGSYVVNYEAKDVAGNITTAQRTVNVVDNTAPVVQVFGKDTIVVEVFGIFNKPFTQATDNYDQDPTVSITGSYDLTTLGVYSIIIVATDASGNVSQGVERWIKVVDTQKPVITLVDDYLTTVERWAPFTDPGVTVTDNYYTGLTPTVGGNFVSTSEEGLFYITYNVTDPSGNVAEEVVRAINVVGNTTGIDKTGGKLGMKLYPNPASAELTIELINTSFAEGKIEVVNMVGQTVKAVTAQDFASTHTLDVSDLAPGVYNISVVSDGNVSILKFVIAR